MFQWCSYLSASWHFGLKRGFSRVADRYLTPTKLEANTKFRNWNYLCLLTIQALVAQPQNNEIILTTLSCRVSSPYVRVLPQRQSRENTVQPLHWQLLCMKTFKISLQNRNALWWICAFMQAKKHFWSISVKHKRARNPSYQKRHKIFGRTWTLKWMIQSRLRNFHPTYIKHTNNVDKLSRRMDDWDKSLSVMKNSCTWSNTQVDFLLTSLSYILYVTLQDTILIPVPKSRWLLLIKPRIPYKLCNWLLSN